MSRIIVDIQLTVTHQYVCKYRIVLCLIAVALPTCSSGVPSIDLAAVIYVDS